MLPGSASSSPRSSPPARRLPGGTAVATAAEEVLSARAEVARPGRQEGRLLPRPLRPSGGCPVIAADAEVTMQSSPPARRLPERGLRGLVLQRVLSARAEVARSSTSACWTRSCPLRPCGGRPPIARQITMASSSSPLVRRLPGSWEPPSIGVQVLSARAEVARACAESPSKTACPLRPRGGCPLVSCASGNCA